MKIAFMFPGQGSQFEQMGKVIYEKYEEAKNIYDKASKILNIDVTKLCFESNLEELSRTENTQIAIAVNSLAILEVLKNKEIQAEISVGLSLGEYVALMNSGVLSLEDGLKLLQKRGYYMQHNIPQEEYSMAAVIGLESSKIEEICEGVRKSGKFVVPANYNCSTQTVISGNRDGVEEASELLKQNGAKRVVLLNTSGPFHTSKLNEAKELYEKELEKVEFKTGSVKVIKNLDGSFYSEEDNVKEILANHIVSPVRFDKAIQVMEKENIDTCIEVGPGKIMIGFVKKELKEKEIEYLTTGTLEELEKTLETLKNS